MHNGSVILWLLCLLGFALTDVLRRQAQNGHYLGSVLVKNDNRAVLADIDLDLEQASLCAPAHIQY